MTLLLAVRRQRHQELAAAHTTHDATERRVTELYTKAADQLGSDKASVHLAGLHALERLAQDTPELRQTIVDVICADLRMPFAKPPDPNAADEPAVPSAAIAGVVASSVGRDPHEERQVRLTAQRILADHLRYQDLPVRRWWQRRRADPNTHHWPDVLLDLNDAVLEDFETASVPRGRRSVLRGPFTGYTLFQPATLRAPPCSTAETSTPEASVVRQAPQVSPPVDACTPAAVDTGDADRQPLYLLLVPALAP
ncbi:hypothetical protein HD597_000085 [Nonomuraea thailandensis]|uniref:Uncharacterized protein n=1 Tax=Nonomuraea thailandensis TaxID=1188745 RepID=A0A9X2JYV3_9ACTN|nr:hypothetical protein [Nonomuraea thailandensis]MCP2353065.1 hypothetical protein [Nonomuraea thailandensis]